MENCAIVSWDQRHSLLFASPAQVLALYLHRAELSEEQTAQTVWSRMKSLIHSVDQIIII